MAPSRASPESTEASLEFLSEQQLATWHRDGFLLIPSYLSISQCNSLLSRINSMLRDFSLTDHPLTKFTTGSEEDGAEDVHVGDDYFLTSGDKVRYFFEEDAFDKQSGELTKPKERAVNKAGHNLHGLVSDFGEISHIGQIGRQNSQIVRDLGFKDPRLLQSMVIFKQPEIGGAVPPHSDSTFLYTNRPSAVGFWFALENATKENGCLSFAPGSHRRTPVKKRFVRKRDGSGTMFEEIEDEPGKWPRDFDHENGSHNEEDIEQYVIGEVEAGTLVLIHGNLLHKSEKNLSKKGRIIYTFHVIEGEEQYDERNWLQIPGGPRAFTQLNGA